MSKSFPNDAMANFADQIEPILAICIGYKAKAKAAGLSDETAEKMAVDLHSMMITKIAGG
jgi:anthranilate/para-aminobenzoate synthase component II